MSLRVKHLVAGTKFVLRDDQLKHTKPTVYEVISLKAPLFRDDVPCKRVDNGHACMVDGFMLVHAADDPMLGQKCMTLENCL